MSKLFIDLLLEDNGSVKDLGELPIDKAEDGSESPKNEEMDDEKMNEEDEINVDDELKDVAADLSMAIIKAIDDVVGPDSGVDDPAAVDAMLNDSPAEGGDEAPPEDNAPVGGDEPPSDEAPAAPVGDGDGDEGSMNFGDGDGDEGGSAPSSDPEELQSRVSELEQENQELKDKLASLSGE